MNSRNKIILGCLSLLVIASVGYALFSEKIAINGVAKAKSDMDVVVTSCYRQGKDLKSEEKNAMYGTDEYNYTGIENNGEEGTCQLSKDGKIKTTSKLNKPSDGIAYSVFIKNMGKQPVKLKEVNSDNNFDMLGIGKADNHYIDGFDGNVDDEGNPINATGLLGYYYLYKLNADGYKHNDTINPELSDSKIEMSQLTILPNEGFYLRIVNYWVNLPNQKKPPKEGLTMSYNVQLVFEQVA